MVSTEMRNSRPHYWTYGLGQRLIPSPWDALDTIFRATLVRRTEDQLKTKENAVGRIALGWTRPTDSVIRSLGH